MRIHILGICGTFMSGVALLAKQCGYEVSGSDMQVYPPMSTQLEKAGITLTEGYDPQAIAANIDYVIVGNVIKRGNPALERVLNLNLPYTSGPAWLAEHILSKRTVLAVSGTHGKTTTSSLLAWILDYAGLNPGFLIGGVPENFGFSARMGQEPFFVIEADEYDSAFFDKRSKFIHYRPQRLILNNLEFDHADIFPDLDAIKQQFHYLIRTIPANGAIVRNANDTNLAAVLDKGCWTPIITFGEKGDWQARLTAPDGSAFNVYHQGEVLGEANWSLLGLHNVNNALAAIATAHTVGIAAKTAIEALAHFQSVKRRLELKGIKRGIAVYDDFAHHPTAIATTLAGLRAKVGTTSRIIAVLEFGSYTMRTGIHKDALREALRDADVVVCKAPTEDWGLASALSTFSQPTALYPDVNQLVQRLCPELKPGDQVIVMSNSGFDGVHEKLLTELNGIS